MSCHTYLVTGPMEARSRLALRTGAVTNWLETRRETTLVTCMEEDSAAFLATARETSVTVEEVRHADGEEQYERLVGEPGTGWKS